MSRTANANMEIHQHSGWWIPFGFVGAVVAACGLLLAWYLLPIPDGSVPTEGSRVVQLNVHGMRLGIPANYIATAGARAGGVRDNVALMALYPSFQGYSQGNASQFAGNAPDSPVIRMVLRAGAGTLDAPERLARIYRPYLVGPAEENSALGLTRYTFADGSGYEGSELFSGHDARGLELFLCEKELPQIPSPNCLALDRPLEGEKGARANLSWRFKRAYLPQWRAVTTGVYDLMARFEQLGRAPDHPPAQAQAQF